MKGMTDKEHALFWEKQFKWLEKQHTEQGQKLDKCEKQLSEIKKIVSR
jgi:hypothetical protein